jgi:hypothetical protein
MSDTLVVPFLGGPKDGLDFAYTPNGDSVPPPEYYILKDSPQATEILDSADPIEPDLERSIYFLNVHHEKGFIYVWEGIDHLALQRFALD